MSYEIEYRHLSIAVSMDGVKELVAAESGNDDYRHHLWTNRLHALFTEQGSSNSYTVTRDRHGREHEERSRRWELFSIGTADDAVYVACRHCGAAERGLIEVRNRITSAEAYIRTYRAALEEAVTDEGAALDLCGKSIIIPTEHPSSGQPHPWQLVAEREGRLQWLEKIESGTTSRSMLLAISAIRDRRRVAADLALAAHHLERSRNGYPRIDHMRFKPMLDAWHDLKPRKRSAKKKQSTDVALTA